MALSTQRASSSSSHAWAEPPHRWKFDVFLSFRGEDTRWGFISHLYHQLQYSQLLNTFIDDRELEIGSDISPELLTAIQHSHLSIVVLSPNYASSTWCLDELAKIVESMEPRDKRVLPVFLNVDPSDVRHQRNSFAEAFAKHEMKFSENLKKVERWREALTKVANLSGWDSKNYKCERELIEVIVKRVWKKVRPTIKLLNSEDKLVGIDFRLGQMGLHLALEKKDVRFIGICGMGGVGKSTLAKLVFERISYHFEVAEFLDVRNSHGQLVKLQKQVLCQFLMGNGSEVWNEDAGAVFIRQFLSNKKVLLVVDDVGSSDLLKKLAGHESWFGEGSRIIVTTRDERVLVENDIEIKFKLPVLNDSEALELFCQKAFKKDQPEEGFSKLTKCFIDYVEGLPLALKILGTSLYKRDLETWESVWDKLQKGSDAKVFNSLNISYESLDYTEQNIFLDVAFFYKGMKKGRVIELLESCDFSARYGIDVLIEKSLITIDVDDIVRMHGLIQEMAEEIVLQETPESRERPGLRSRLLHRNDIFHVFTTNTGTEAIKGICLRLSQLEEADPNWNFECFSKMVKLRFLEFDNLIISSGPKFLPKSLKVLKWSWYPSKSLPASFRPNLLAELQMQKSKLIELWDGRMDLPNLKDIDLSGSRNLKKTPEFTGTPNLERLNLASCGGLVDIHPSIAVHKKLKWLILEECKNVKSFPRKIEMDSLEELNLTYCSKLKIPEFGEGMKKLSRLRIPGTASEELPSSVEHLVGLTLLEIYDSKRLQSIPGTTIFKLKSLEAVDLYKCPKLKKIAENRGETECLKSFMRNKLHSLLGRKSPEPLCLSLPSPRALPSLTSLYLTDCHLSQGVIPDDIGYCFPSLEELLLGGNNFVTLPASIKCLTHLFWLDLRRCKRLQELPDLPSNRDLEIWADDCESLKKLSEPSQQGTATDLERFCLTSVNCFGLIDSEGFTNGIFSMLRRLATQRLSSDFDKFESVSPGSKISEWFDIQSEGGPLTVELPPHQKKCKSEWMGIVFCVVFADQKEPHTRDCSSFSIECLSPGAGLKHINCSEEHSLCLKIQRHMMGDHLWVSFMPRCLIQDTTSCSFTFSFNAYYLHGNDRIPCPNSVKRCGARLSYEQDLKNLLNPPTNIMKRSREYCDSEARDSRSESASGSSNNESFFKRLKA